MSKGLVPALRFREFRNDFWQELRLGDVCITYSGGTPNTSEQRYYGGEIPFIRSAEIGKDKTELFLTNEGLKSSSAKLVNKGDVLVALYGANSGDVAISKIDGAINQAILCIKSDENNVFIYQFLSLKKDWVIQKYIQGGQGNLSGDIIKSLVLLFPARMEQQKIADCLSSLDDLITAQTQKLDFLKAHKKGLMQDLFPGEGERVPRLRFTGVSGIQFPDWEMIPLNYVADRITQKNKDLQVSLVLTNSASNGIVNQSDHFDREIVTKDSLDGYYVVENGDFVYNPRISTVAPVGPISRNKGQKGIMSPLYTVFRFRNRHLGFYEQYFKSSHWHNYLKDVSNSGARHDRINISNEDFMKMPIPNPHDQEQRKIADCLSSLDDQIQSQTQKIESLKLHKKGLMQQLFPSP